MINLTYPLYNGTPVYGGGRSPVIKSGKKILAGDNCNTLEISFTNHTGTHIDFPAHFDATGKTLTDYPPGFWYTEKIECLFMDMNKTFFSGELIGILEIKHLLSDNIENDIEVILLKTGFCENRESEIYWKKPPGIDPNLPDFLRQKFPRLRFLGMDLISVSSFANREAGRLAHKVLLKHSHPILPIEDMNLCSLPETLSNILIAPLYIKDADGAPCTVFADIGL
jgi:arylformamidase